MSYNVLKVGEHVMQDESIISYQYHTHQPYSSTTFNHNDEIRIPIQTQDLYTLPSQSYLYIEGTLLKEDNTPSKAVHFVNNGILHLFDEIRYELGGIVVDRIRNPGITSTMKGYLSFTPLQHNLLQNSGWSADTNPPILDSTGNFNVCIRLEMLMGFGEDFTKIIMNTRQELVLVRSNSDLNAFQSDQKETYKLKLNKVLWKMPHITVSDYQKLKLFKQFESNKDLTIAFRKWELHEHPQLQQSKVHTWAVKSSSQLEKPRFIIIGFQTDLKNKQEKNMSTFNHCNLVNLKVYLNSEMFPYDNLNLDFYNNKFSILYDMYAQFQKTYYYRNYCQPCLNPINFKIQVPLVVIDCSQQNEDLLKAGAVDIRIEFETEKAIPANTAAYCLILHD